MRDSFFGVAALVIASSGVVGCGGSQSVNFFQGGGGQAGGATSGGSTSSASGASAGGAPVTGDNTFTSGGAPASAGSNANAGGGASAGSASSVAGSAGTPSGPSDAPCSPAMEGVNSSSGSFNTLGESCWRVSMDISGWGCNDIEGRTIKVNGTLVTCAQLPLPDKVHGDYYFDFSAGEHEYASFFWF